MNWIQQIEAYRPYNEQEKSDQRVILDFSKSHEDVLTRANKIAHLTSSGFIINADRSKTLMIHHNIYNSWAWTGGHMDGDTDLLGVAIREAEEETGVLGIKAVSENIFSIEILPVLGHIKRDEYVSAHLHLSIAFLLEADEHYPLTVKEDENSNVKWIPIEEINTYSTEEMMHGVYAKLVEKMNKIGL